MKRSLFSVALLVFIIPILFTLAFAEGTVIKEGDEAPDFTLESSDGGKVSLKDLKGKKVVLWFYPKDDTPG
jgi:peroxiredoxin